MLHVMVGLTGAGKKALISVSDKTGLIELAKVNIYSDGQSIFLRLTSCLTAMQSLQHGSSDR